jgi:hypothetical protein
MKNFSVDIIDDSLQIKKAARFRAALLTGAQASFLHCHRTVFSLFRTVFDKYRTVSDKFRTAYFKI